MDHQDDGGGLVVKAKHKGNFFTIVRMLIDNLMISSREHEFVVLATHQTIMKSKLILKRWETTDMRTASTDF